MKKKLYIIIVSILAICFLVAIGYSYYDEDGFLNNRDTKFYSNFNRFNRFKFYKSEWVSGQTPRLTWSPDNVQYENGKMLLSIRNDDSGLTGGEILSLKKYGFGLYQVRMKPIKNTGAVSSFFNYFNDGDKGTEIDIEFLGYDTTKIQFNYYTDGVGGHAYLYDLGFDAAEEYHDYAFNWTSDSIQWFVDGEMVYEANENIPQLEAQIFMNAWTGDEIEWHKEYDGTSPLYAYYDWTSYTELK
ncbi:family 16 glycosylhydrolase [Butyrivibrio sp. WCD2001]|uniref:family 16 glycosylhydrolase n=1 Tax=Butyrivibrio sp. WCD2001 TaxID=1280681 RepID=UPI00047CD4DA|nr:family 16 glycosylhydrolase [Butyrivibrio sp. WCD2001]